MQILFDTRVLYVPDYPINCKVFWNVIQPEIRYF